MLSDRLLVHGIATYHGLVSSSHDVVEGSDRCSSLLQGSSLTAAAAVDAASAATETAKAASSFSPSKSSVVEQITRSSTHAFAGSEAAASVAAGPAAAAAPGGISDLRHSQPSPSQYQGAHSLGRVTVVRQRQQVVFKTACTTVSSDPNSHPYFPYWPLHFNPDIIQAYHRYCMYHTDKGLCGFRVVTIAYTLHVTTWER
jgi:hypothetical protein